MLRNVNNAAMQLEFKQNKACDWLLLILYPDGTNLSNQSTKKYMYNTEHRGIARLEGAGGGGGGGGGLVPPRGRFFF